jgi:hypothetical protein
MIIMIYIQVKSSSSRPHQSTCSSAETGTFDDEENLSEVTFFVLICQNDDNNLHDLHYLHDDNDPMATSVPILLVFFYFS